jgi:hypothetical protein
MSRGREASWHTEETNSAMARRAAMASGVKRPRAGVLREPDAQGSMENAAPDEESIFLDVGVGRSVLVTEPIVGAEVVGGDRPSAPGAHGGCAAAPGAVGHTAPSSATSRIRPGSASTQTTPVVHSRRSCIRTS